MCEGEGTCEEERTRGVFSEWVQLVGAGDLGVDFGVLTSEEEKETGGARGWERGPSTFPLLSVPRWPSLACLLFAKYVSQGCCRSNQRRSDIQVKNYERKENKEFGARQHKHK